MSATELVASLTASLAWPVAAVVVVLVLRKPLRALLARVSGVKGPGGLEASFAVAALEVEAAAAMVHEGAGMLPLPRQEPASDGGGSSAPNLAWERTEHLDQLLSATREDDSTPALRRVVATAWHMMSSAAQEAAVRQGARDELLSCREATAMLDKAGQLKPGISGLVAELSSMRERAFESPELDPRSVRTFVKAAGRVTRAFDRVPKRPAAQPQEH